MLIIKVVKGEGQSSWKIKMIIEEIHKLIEGCQEIHMDHISCEGNGVADELEKYGHNITQIIKWKDVRQTPSSTQVIMERKRATYNVI